MTRRELLLNSTLPLAATALRGQSSSSRMGIATTSYMTFRKFQDTLEFLEHCHSLGAAGIQSAINGDPAKIRARAQSFNMFVEAITGMPKNGDSTAFEAAIQKAKAAGALLVRVNAGGRRYEDFSNLADYQTFAERSRAALRSALAVCEKHRIPFALENHKDWTLDQMLDILKGYSSEYLGVCLDFGNNLSLSEDPMQVVEQLAPYALTTHVKDMGVEPCPDGFLMSEVPLGTGFLDLPRMFERVRQARPRANFVLEMITRDPLKIPCLTDRYWATFPDRKAQDLARTLRLVRDHRNRDQPLPRLSNLSREQQLRTEEDNVQACLRYARETLKT